MISWVIRFYSKRYWLYFLLIALAYCFSIDVPYYFDDIHSLQDNLALRDLHHWYAHWFNPDLTSSLPANRSYRPLTFMIYNLLMVAGSGGVLLFHLHKLVLLFGICILVEKIWNRLNEEHSPYFGFSLACVWAVHPSLSESAVYLSATSSLQAAFFYFLAYWLFLKSPANWLLVTIAYAASCFSKEEGITLPAVLILTTILKRNFRDNARTLGVVTAAGFALLLLIYSHIPAAQSVSRGGVSSIDYFYTQIRAWIHYMQLWLWPVGLNADNTEFGFSSTWRDPKVLGCLSLQLAMLVGAWRVRARAPLLLFGLAWYYITISPASSVIPLAEPVNERRMLIAYLGFTGAVQWLLFASMRRWTTVSLNARAAGFAVLLLLATIVTALRVQVWRHPLQLWQDVVDKNPSSVRAYNNLASEQITLGDYEGALINVQKCLERSTYLYCKINEGIALTQLQRYADAAAAFEWAVRNSSNDAVPHYYYADYWFKVGDLQNAFKEVNIALQISGGNHGPSLQLRERILHAAQQTLPH